VGFPTTEMRGQFPRPCPCRQGRAFFPNDAATGATGPSTVTVSKLTDDGTNLVYYGNKFYVIRKTTAVPEPQLHQQFVHERQPDCGARCWCRVARLRAHPERRTGVASHC
jgi:hypothetical protein